MDGRVNLQKDRIRISNKAHLFPIRGLLKNRKFNYTISSILVLMFVLFLGFQNCGKNGAKNGGGTIERASVGDKAIFKLSEKYGGDISNIFWKVVEEDGACGDRIVATGKEEGIEINWDDVYLGDFFVIEAFMQLGEESCITYRQLHFYVSSPVSMVMVCDPDYISEIIFTPSSNESPIKKYFPIGTLIDFEFEVYGAMMDPPDFNFFQWGIKRLVLEDETELADQTNKTVNLTHTFLEKGLYDISVKASSSSENRSASIQLLIGRCEGDNLDDVEIVFDGDSIGYQTPEKISNMGPIWNYVRPSSTDPNVNITTSAIDNSLFGGYIYKYPRNSSSKFIDIDIQNADECFLDTEPLSTTECIPSGCSSDAADCNCEYEIRENLSSLSSCSGNALDMSALDTDTTQCTDAIFVVAASKTGQEYKSQRTFYKYCPADQDYCYFGYKSDRPSDHHCPSS